MNPTACLFVKLSILVALSCQVLGSEHFGSGGQLVEKRLDALRHSSAKLRRRQVELGGATGGTAGAKSDATKPSATKPDATKPDATKPDATKPDATKPDATKPDATAGATKPDARTDATKADAKAAADGKRGADGTGQNPSKEEQLATKLFEGIIQMGIGLESVTSLGSTTQEIVDQSKKVSAIVPTLKTLTTDLLSAAPKKSDELNKALDDSSKAGEAITKSLQTIEQKPDDANTIKNEFKTLEKSFQQILATSDGVAVAAIPKLAELAKKDEEDAKKAPGETNGQNAEVKLQSAGEPAPAAAKDAGPEKKAEPRKAEERGAASAGDKPIDEAALTEKKEGDVKPAETKPAETKPAETKPADTKPADTTKPAAEQPAAPQPEAAAPQAKGAIEPIETGVVV